MHIESNLKYLRHSLHQCAELSGHESATASFLLQFLKNQHPSEIIESLGGQGIAASYIFSNDGPTVLFRCEIDALPIDEDHLSLKYKSKNAGRSHKCGHDGHMTILAGLAQKLSQTSYGRGKIVLLFQPAEETGEGAQRVLADPKFKAIKPDYVFALHNLPGYKKDIILCKEGTFTAAVCSMIIRIQGVASHASEPEKGKNPSLCMSEIAKIAEALTYNQPEYINFQLITPVYYRMGQPAYGMSAGDGEMHFTLRAWTSENLDKLISEFISHIRDIEEKNKLNISIEFLENFASTQNDTGAVRVIWEATAKTKLEYHSMGSPFKFGEDFGLFTQHYAGAMFGLGAGLDHPPLHHRDYDFPDDLIDTGVQMFLEIIDLIIGPRTLIDFHNRPLV